MFGYTQAYKEPLFNCSWAQYCQIASSCFFLVPQNYFGRSRTRETGWRLCCPLLCCFQKGVKEKIVLLQTFIVLKGKQKWFNGWPLRLPATLVICIIRSMDDEVRACSNGSMYLSPRTTKYRYINYIILSFKFEILCCILPKKPHWIIYSNFISFQMGWVGKNDWRSLSFWQLVMLMF